MPKLVNVTRLSEDIPARLRAEGKYHFVPVYHLLRLSELGREGIERNGSFRFADHIYANKAKGTTMLGKGLDRLLLSLPSARSFRNRYLQSRDVVREVISERKTHTDPIDILAVPSGLARELFDVAEEIAHDTEVSGRTTFHFVDLDDEPLALVREKATQAGHRAQITQGDALDHTTYADQKYDAIVSLGFAEFLSDEETLEFYKLARSKLKPGGKLITSGLMPHRLSDYLMRQFAELHTSYRSREELLALAAAAGYRDYVATSDQHGLQTLLVCTHDHEL
jgi:hypothetical protein